MKNGTDLIEFLASRMAIWRGCSIEACLCDAVAVIELAKSRDVNRLIIHPDGAVTIPGKS